MNWISIVAELISLIALELLRRNNKNTDLIKNKLGGVSEQIQNNKDHYLTCIHDLKNDMVIVKEKIIQMELSQEKLDT
ncbi:MAG: hypothetical protein HC874_07335 [Richelia sp. SL_2_1]|nr:hypothetical protein [Richelia sp. SM1_7_0]NJN09242.1 hypothetical protein [Richelia sp. RM1_1_1]NJO27376.1 hypothetical protein [Richelia sp. SL_2_1]